MSARSDSRGDPTDGCGIAPVRAALERICASPGFATSAQLRMFLSYVVARRLEGADDRIKGYTIAVEALGRDPSFDPSSDPIVRVEAARLRRMLDDYYAGSGAYDPVRIGIPKGGYVPHFSKHAAVAPDTAAPTSRTRPFGAGKLAMAAGFVVVLAAGTIWLAFPRFASEPAPPSLQTAVQQDAGALSAYKGQLPIVHVAEIAEEPATRLPEGFSGAILRADLDMALARFDEIAVSDAAEAADYRLDGRIASDDDRLFLNFRLIYQETGEVVWSSLFDVAQTDETPGLVQERVARNAATAIAQPYGVIFNHATARSGGGASGPEGLRCVLQTFNAQRRFSADMNARSRACLASLATGKAAPPAVHALLPLVYVDDVRSGADPTGRDAALAQALDLARRAVELTPQSGRAYQALESVLMFLGQTDEAITAGRRALELNPNDPDILATHGGTLVMAGDSREGLDLLKRAARLSPDHPDWYTIMTVFGALQEGDTALARVEAANLHETGTLSNRLARLLVAQENGDRNAARDLVAALKIDFPEFASDPDAALRATLPSPTLRARLVAVMGKAVSNDR